MDDLAAGLSRRHKASGKKLITHVLWKVVGFTGQERFIDLYTALQHLRIRRNLISGLETDQIIKYQVFGRNGPFLSFPDDDGFLRCQDSQLVNRLFRTDLLCDSDQSIDDDDPYKKRVLVRANHQYQDKEHQIQEVEESQGVFSDDLLVSPGIRILVRIDLTLLDPFIYLFVCKSCQHFTSQFTDHFVHSQFPANSDFYFTVDVSMFLPSQPLFN